MTDPAHAVLAHHPLVEALPAVVPMVVVVLAFVAIVVSDRRRTRRRRAEGRQRADWDGDGSPLR